MADVSSRADVSVRRRGSRSSMKSIDKHDPETFSALSATETTSTQCSSAAPSGIWAVGGGNPDPCPDEPECVSDISHQTTAAEFVEACPIRADPITDQNRSEHADGSSKGTAEVDLPNPSPLSEVLADLNQLINWVEKLPIAKRMSSSIPGTLKRQISNNSLVSWLLHSGWERFMRSVLPIVRVSTEWAFVDRLLSLFAYFYFQAKKLFVRLNSRVEGPFRRIIEVAPSAVVKIDQSMRMAVHYAMSPWKLTAIGWKVYEGLNALLFAGIPAQTAANMVQKVKKMSMGRLQEIIRKINVLKQQLVDNQYHDVLQRVLAISPVQKVLSLIGLKSMTPA